jgi:Xaa-Pro aminopeptidase
LLEPLAGFSPETFRRRRERAVAALGDGVLVLPAQPIRYRSRDTEYRYRPDSELFYLTGLTEPDVVAVLSPGDQGFVLFVRERSPEAELWSGARLGPDAAQELTGADVVYPIGELDTRLPGLLTGPRQVHYRMGSEPRADRLVLESLTHGRARGPRKGSGPRALVDPGEAIDDLRLIKDAEEIDHIRRAAAISVVGFQAALGATAPGVGEWELEAVLDGTFRRAGGDGPGYDSIVGGGENGCVLHYVDNARPLDDGDLVLIDAGAAFRLYSADITRTFPVSGRFTGEQRAVYEIVEAARAAAMAAIRPGTTIAAVHDAALAVIVPGLVELGVLQGDPAALAADEKHKPFYPHQTSHWLGLDVHDVGDYARNGESRVLEPGMVFTVEPGLYFGGPCEGGAERFAGIGVRVEDDVLVTQSGCENLTAALTTDADRLAELVGRAR